MTSLANGRDYVILCSYIYYNVLQFKTSRPRYERITVYASRHRADQPRNMYCIITIIMHRKWFLPEHLMNYYNTS